MLAPAPSSMNPGNLVKVNDTNALTTLNQIIPIYVQFNIPEAQLAAVRAGSALPAEKGSAKEHR